MKAQDALTRVIEHREIFHDEMLDLMRQIMSGEMSPVMIAAITTALRVKKETIGVGNPLLLSLAHLPSAFSILTPAAPASGWASIKRMHSLSTCSPTMVSGFRRSTYSASL